MEIEKFIPIGKENAITRVDLKALCGLSDRAMRARIEDARHNGHIILNLQDGSGYFKADAADLNEIKKQYATNRARALSILHYNKYLRKKIDELKKEEE